MVVPKATYIARSVLSKTFTHGYIQSVVAASQSSYAVQQHSFGNLGNRLGKTQNLQHHNAFQDRNPQGTAKQQQESGLAAYYAAWQKHQQVGSKEWQQFQFAKRIEWVPQTLLAESKSQSKDDVKEEIGDEVQEQEQAPAQRLDRSYSTSALDDFKK